MLTHRSAFSGFSANDIGAARAFYADALGVDATESDGMLTIKVGSQTVLVYPKDNHEPATYTVLNFEVDDIDRAADELAAAGVELERYDGFGQDARGIMRDDGPPIAWFRDPAGNILSIIQTDPNDVP
jgi:catechol 2,3-dioxygenase-like lactoylglutathione lyase family enzyme